MSTNSIPPTDPAEPRPVRRTLNLYITPGSTVDRVVTLSGDRELSRTVAGMLDRYLALLHRATPKFSDRELCAIIDALGDNWEATPGNIQNLPREVMSAVTADRLDNKWELDAATLRPRLDRTTFVERVTLAEMATGYWQLATSESYPQDVIAQLKDLIRSPDTKPTETQRPAASPPKPSTAAAAGTPTPATPTHTRATIRPAPRPAATPATTSPTRAQTATALTPTTRTPATAAPTATPDHPIPLSPKTRCCNQGTQGRPRGDTKPRGSTPAAAMARADTRSPTPAKSEHRAR